MKRKNIMLKKILLGTGFVLIIGALIFGAVNRTQAKGSSGIGSAGTGNGSSGTGIGSAGKGNGSSGTGIGSAGTGIGSAGTGIGSAGTGNGNGSGRGASGQGDGDRNENHAGELVGLPPTEPGDLSAEETTALGFMREEEKLAHDVYVTLYAQWGLPIFQNIASSEQTHMDSILTLLERYGLTDPVSAQVGVFTNPDLQALYTQLVACSSVSLAEALKVGGAIEEIDILDLDESLAQTSRADIQQVFANLRSGSENHLRSFASTLLTQTGEVYQPQYLSPEAYQAILASDAQAGSGQGQGDGNSQGGGRGNRGGRP
jgi:hypothetical protein